ncbi:MAG: TetR/AcrR family transcriptional regulator [Prevotellaceae bacterium]|jgi:AcrR family transcriptional regulator|nr:TetR/AcrR family transcriptional regulator [Prevotellaceae bacterium]
MDKKKDTVKADVRAQILQAAEEEFLAVGYDGARTTAIARRAGVTSAMLHYYFQTKRQLFEMVFRQKAGMFFGSFVNIMEEPMPFIEKIKFFIDTHWRILQLNPGIPLFIINEVRKNPDLLKNAVLEDNNAGGNPFNRFFKAFEKEMHAAIRAHIVRPVEPVEVLMMILSLNIFPFVVQPVLIAAGVISESHSRRIIKNRSQHVIELVLNAILEPEQPS